MELLEGYKEVLRVCDNIGASKEETLNTLDKYARTVCFDKTFSAVQCKGDCRTEQLIGDYYYCIKCGFVYPF